MPPRATEGGAAPVAAFLLCNSTHILPDPLVTLCGTTGAYFTGRDSTLNTKDLLLLCSKVLRWLDSRGETVLEAPQLTPVPNHCTYDSVHLLCLIRSYHDDPRTAPALGGFPGLRRPTRQSRPVCVRRRPRGMVWRRPARASSRGTTGGCTPEDLNNRYVCLALHLPLVCRRYPGLLNFG